MRNNYEIRGDVTAIFLNSRKYGSMETFIATSDLEKVKEFPYTWYVKYSKVGFYVNGNLMQENGVQRTVKLHRWLLDVTDPKLHVNHIMHDTLDNCRWALNVVTNTQNAQNARTKINNKSGYSGVKWNKQLSKWEVSIGVDRKREYLGVYENLTDAISARKDAELKYYEYKKKLELGVAN